MSFKIGGRTIGEGRCFIIGEVGLAHDGSLQAAHAYVDAIAQAGADAVKFQLHIADHEPDAPMRVPHPQYKDRHEQWKRTAFDEDGWQELFNHVLDWGMFFLCSPFSIPAVNWMRAKVMLWKIPSGEITNQPLLRAIAATGMPALLSTGMATHDEVGRAMLDLANVPVVPMQCTSSYPCPPERVGLGVMAKWREYGFAVGLSDHSGTIYPGLAAVTLGCDVLEVHVKLSPWDQGPDASSSIIPEQLKQLVEGCRFIETMKANPVDKDAMARELESMRELFMRKAALA